MNMYCRFFEVLTLVKKCTTLSWETIQTHVFDSSLHRLGNTNKCVMVAASLAFLHASVFLEKEVDSPLLFVMTKMLHLCYKTLFIFTSFGWQVQTQTVSQAHHDTGHGPCAKYITTLNFHNLSYTFTCPRNSCAHKRVLAVA